MSTKTIETLDIFASDKPLSSRQLRRRMARFGGGHRRVTPADMKKVTAKKLPTTRTKAFMEYVSA